VVAAVPLRVVFFGTPAFAVPTLDALLASAHPVVGVVTQPDRPRGRGQKVSDAPVKARAINAAVPLLQPSTLKDPTFLKAFSDLNADIGVVAAYGKILPGAVLTTPRLGLINVHASLLPRYRGAAPIARAIVAGERETGVTIMRVVQALDAGPMLAESRRPIGPDETSDEVERDLAGIGASLLVSTMDRLARGAVDEIAQDDTQSTYAPRLTKEDGLIDWSKPAVDLHNLVRGLHPWPHAFTFLATQRLIIHRTSQRSEQSAAAPGEVIEATADRLRVATGAGVLDLLELQAEGKRPMAARDFLTGHPIRPGDRFTRHA